MADALHHQRCRIHPDREAMARCPECRHDFCRECVSDHGGRQLCAACIRKLTDKVNEEKKPVDSKLRLAVLFACCVLLVWSILYYTSRALLLVPMETHD